jgi:hypothetical protein
MSQSPGLCPHCGAVLEITFLAPGDKAARCRYCDLVIDLPDGEQTVTEEESVSPDGTRVKRRVEVSRGGAGPSGDLMDQVNQMMAQVQGKALQENEQRTVKHVEHRVISSETTVEGDMPDGVEDMLAGMGITFGPTAPAAVSKDVVVTWPDGAQYGGTLVEEREEQALVEFADGSRRWVPIGSVQRR